MAKPVHLVGLISDTHGLVRSDVFPALEGVELILHAGDVGEGVLEELSAIAPVDAVYGNTDPTDDPRLKASIECTIDGVRVHVSHGHELGRPAVLPFAVFRPRESATPGTGSRRRNRR